jgi:hypothetical protein
LSDAKTRVLQRIGAHVGAAIGREHLVVRAIRPAYEALLDLLTLGRADFFRKPTSATSGRTCVPVSNRATSC